MKSTNLLESTLLFTLITIVHSQSFYISPVRITNNCRENEVFTNCGSACDLTCENVTSTRIDEQRSKNYEPFVVLDEPCKYNCIPGCYCRKPLFRNRFGQCVEETECRKSLNRNDFVEELNKFLNLNFDNYNDQTVPTPNPTDSQRQRPNQKYIAVNDDSESIVNPRTGYYPSRKTGYQSSTPGHNFFNIEKDFFTNLFDDLLSHHLPSKQTNNRPINYQNNNYQTSDNGNIYANDDNSLDKQIEKEAILIIQQITNGLKIKKFIIETLRNLVHKSQYNLGSFASSSINDKKNEPAKNGIISTS